MVTAQIPGINISILRQSTFGRRGEPIFISGRVTALGIGVPALVRVALEGPTFDPQVTNFDTFAAPVTGDYTVPVIAEKDGEYRVTARAYPPIAIPSPPGIPSPIDILPPTGESPSPPLVIGEPLNGDIFADTPEGRRRIQQPPLSEIEIQAPVTVAPAFPITLGFPGAPGAPRPAAPSAPAAPPDVPGPIFIIPDVPAPTPPPAIPPPEVPPPDGVVGAQLVGFTLV
jgi:hypothetical protein